MKLKQFRVREFRSIWDSGPIDVDDTVTCLVGKNESGKTALLHALYRTNPILPDDANFDLTFDYPKQEVEDYRIQVEKNSRRPANVVDCTYQLDENELAPIETSFGTGVIESDCFHHRTFYGKQTSDFTLHVNTLEARRHLTSGLAVSAETQERLETAEDWKDISKILHDIEETEPIKLCKSLAKSIADSGSLENYIFTTFIWPYAPKFLYFDEYYQLTGQENLNALVRRIEANDLKESDRPLLVLINLARLDYRELLNSDNTTKLKNQLEGAGNHLTSRIVKYWSQNRHIHMRFDVRDAKPQDPPEMRDGTTIWGEIYDSVHWAHTPLKSRSRGFIWFFSFLAWYEDVKRRGENVFLLLDEPGLSLHGRAQADLLKYFEDELAPHQLIYSTHSPFMVDPRHFGRVRIVQDSGIDSKEQLPREQDGTKVLANVFDATEDSLFPLQGALGYEIHQTLFVGPNILVIEGPSDMLYIRAMSDQLEREGRTGLSNHWTLTPVGGIGKVLTFVALLAPQRDVNVAVLLDFQNKDRVLIEDLYKNKLVKKRNVMVYSDVLDQPEADVEDLFSREFYLTLVNAEFKDELESPIAVEGLNAHVPRVLLAVSEHMNDHPMQAGVFNHYRPARYLFENVGDLWALVPSETKDCFEQLFVNANKLLESPR